MTTPDDDLAAGFDQEFGRPPSAVMARVWAAVLGNEYPAELAPYSWITRSELAMFVREVRVGEGDLLVDVGSGRGGPGLWVAARTGADHLAVDVAEAGLEAVREAAARLGVGGRSRTALGSFEQLPLDNAAADAVMSVDALLFTPDKAAAVRELARVVRPGGRLVLTTWDYTKQPVGRPPQVDDHRPLLSAAGFDVLRYEETEDWERRERETCRLLLESADDLAAEEGDDPDEVRDSIREMAATIDAVLRRVLVVAQRTDRS
ncbi:MAG TPA: class I SAM-dependent methyltransferase [Actinomycetes bacterium]|nr:class I SAM-dependent methyltransferase [Actinomycetes bacterium]